MEKMDKVDNENINPDITENLPEEKETQNKPEEKINKPEEVKSMKKELFSFAREFAFALIVSILITRFVFIIPLVPTGSMIPTININERILVDKLSLHFKPVQRGDIVVFPCPDIPEELYVKRVIGMAGETVEIRDYKVYINGEVLDEPYLVVETNGNDGPYHVPEGHIFVLGDNRNSSRDSRRWVTTNYVNLSDVQGRGMAVLWPLNAIRWLE